MMSVLSQAFLRRFHAARPGVTAAALARGDAGGGRSTYARLAACLRRGERVLELGCGDGVLLAELAAREVSAIGLDMSPEELALARARGATVVQGCAQQLPFAGARFDAVVSHLAFTLMDEVDAIAAEVARVLVPGGRLLAVVGGGPAADADDAFTRWLQLIAGASTDRPRAPRLGDPRARSEAGWRAMFAPYGGRELGFERWAVDLGGAFDDVWTTLSTIYEADGLALDPLRAAFVAATASLGPRPPCTMIVWLASVRLGTDAVGAATR
jgi:SAM-dependent methyltransferase